MSERGNRWISSILPYDLRIQNGLVVIATISLFTSAILGPILPGISIGRYNVFIFRLYFPLYVVGSGWVLFREGRWVSLPRSIQLFAAFGVYAALSLLWATAGITLAVRGLFLLLSSMFVGGTVLWTTRDKHTLSVYLLVVFVLVAAGEIISLWEIFTGGHLATSRLLEPGHRLLEGTYFGVDVATAWFYNRNDIAFFLVLALGPLFAYTISPRRRRLFRGFTLSSVVISLAIFFANGAWSALLAAVLTVVVVSTLTAVHPRLQPMSFPRWGRTAVTGVMLLAAVISFTTVVLVSNPFAGVYESFSLRWQVGVAATQLFIDSHGLGVGVGSFPTAVQALPLSTNGTLAPHHWLFYLFGAFGVVGTVLFLTAYARLLYDLFERTVVAGGPIRIGLFGTLLALPISALGSSNAVNTPSFWLFVGLAAAAAYIGTDRSFME